MRMVTFGMVLVATVVGSAWSLTHTTALTFVTPTDRPGQRVMSFSLEVEPHSSALQGGRDFFGNEATAIACFEPHRRFTARAFNFRAADVRQYGPHDACSDAICQAQQIVALSVVSVSPDMGIRLRIKQTNDDAYVGASLCDPAGQKIARAAMLRVGHPNTGSLRGCDRKGAHPTQYGRDSLGEIFPKCSAFRIGGRILRRQHGNRRSGP